MTFPFYFIRKITYLFTSKQTVYPMKRIILILIAAGMLFATGYAQQSEVVTLGVFHIEFPNLDVKQYSEEEQIDVWLPQYQKEMEMIAQKLARFKPDAVVVEWPLSWQQKTDSIYREYLAGNHRLSRNEVEQLGFRQPEDIQECAAHTQRQADSCHLRSRTFESAELPL